MGNVHSVADGAQLLIQLDNRKTGTVVFVDHKRIEPDKGELNILGIFNSLREYSKEKGSSPSSIMVDVLMSYRIRFSEYRDIDGILKKYGFYNVHYYIYNTSSGKMSQLDKMPAILIPYKLH